MSLMLAKYQVNKDNMKHFVFSFALCIAMFLRTVAIAQAPGISVDGKLYDTDHHLVNAHGAGVMYHNGVYYLFGEIKKGTTWEVPNQSWEDYRVPAGGISCYSSKDLKHWKYEGVALASIKGQPDNDLDTGRVIERPKVIYNSKTKQFVMWMHIDKKDYSYSQSGVAISDNPIGPYHYISSVKPNGQMSRDMTLFKDDDGKAYLIYSSEQNNTMQVCLLSDDYLSPTKTFSRILVNRRREAPALFKNEGKYYLITSDCSGWSPNAATYAVADNILGPYNENGNPCVGPGANTTFQSQSTYIIKVKGKNNYLFMADRWNKTDLEKSDYLWLPLNVSNGKVEIKSVAAAN
jgi:beta-xylosidase